MFQFEEIWPAAFWCGFVGLGLSDNFTAVVAGAGIVDYPSRGGVSCSKPGLCGCRCWSVLSVAGYWAPGAAGDQRARNVGTVLDALATLSTARAEAAAKNAAAAAALARTNAAAANVVARVAAGVAEDSANRKVMMQLYATLREKAEAAEAEAKTQAATAEVAAKVAMAAPRAKTKEYEDAARVAALQWCDERGSSPRIAPQIC